MPEPSSGGCVGGKTRRPQPRPRLSLVLTKDDAICPLYENLQNLRKDYQALQDEKETVADDIHKEEDMATTNKNLGKSATGFRRSTLPVPLTVTTGNIPVTRRNANLVGSGSGGGGGVVVATVHRPSVGRSAVQTSFLHHTFNAAPSATGTAPSSTIRCMPYNSPRMAKSSRINSTTAAPPVNVVQNGHGGPPDRMTKERPFATASLAKTVNATAVALGKLHRSEENLSPRTRSTDGGLSAPTVVALPIRKPVVTWRKRAPIVSTGDGAALTVNGSTDRKEDLAPTPGVAGDTKTEYRKSASIPPLMVANLTNQFNALIERSQNTLKAELHLRRSHRAKSGALVRTGAGGLSNGSTNGEPPPSPVVAIQSCPSSPLHRSTAFKLGRSEESAKYGVAESPRFGRAMEPAKDNAKSISAVTRSTETASLSSSKCATTSDFQTGETERLPVGDLDGMCHKLTNVQRAIRSFEVTLTKSTSSPELPRKKLEMRSGASASRQSQTLPPTNPPPSYGLTKLGSRPTATRTLPHFPCTSLPQTTDEKTKAGSLPTSFLPRPLLSEVTKEAASSKPLGGVRTSERSTVQTSVTTQSLVTEAIRNNKSTATSTAPKAAVRTSLLGGQRGGAASVYQNAAVKSMASAENVFHTRSTRKIQNRKLPDVPADPNSATRGSSSSIASASEDAIERRSAEPHANDAVSAASSRPGSKNSEVAFDAASDQSTGSRESMDLLAEIDNDPQMIAAFSRKTWSSSLTVQTVTCTLDKDTGSGPIKAPNASFLWKSSTQLKVGQESTVSQTTVTVSTDRPQPSSSKECLPHSYKESVDDQDTDDDDDDHVYEELFNCLSIGSDVTSRLPPPRDDVPLALPEVDDMDLLDEEGSLHPLLTYSTARRSLDSRTTTKTGSSQERLEEVASDGSWTDDSDNGDTEEDESINVAHFVKPRIRGKKQPHRKHLVRRSWSQSLRDLAQNHDSDAKVHTDGEGAWEEEMGSDSSSDHIYTEPIQNNDLEPSENEMLQTNFVTDTDSDKSPTSVTGGSASDVNKMEHPRESHKGKRVKRNWSWSKTDFHLDLTKLGKIRMPKKPSTKIGGESSTTDESPTKKKQWPFRGKVASKKGEKVVAPKQQPSPKKESALFYVPTVNADGSLASPPDHLANLDFQVPADSDGADTSSLLQEYGSTVSVSRISIELVTTHSTTTTATTIVTTVAPSSSSAVTANVPTSAPAMSASVTTAVKKARRISGGGSISRPKTAPPAPPVFAFKFAPPVSEASSRQPSAAVSVCSEASTEPTSMADGGSGRSRSISPAQNVEGHHTNSDQSDSSLTRGSFLQRGTAGGSFARRSVSSMSSDGEVMATVMNRLSKTRASMASSHSGSSADSYIQMDDDISVHGSTSSGTAICVQGMTPTPSTIPEDIASESSTLKNNSSKGFLYLDDTYFIDDDRNLKLSPFAEEPLYQFYNMAARQRAAHENQLESSDEDFYESPYPRTPSETSVTTVTSVPSAMELVKSTEGGIRTLWCEVPEVIASGILDTISPQERKLQEAMFEVITSEASYLKSLNVLVNHFMLCPLFMDDYSLDCVLNRREKYVLFSDVIPVKETSERLLAELEKRWQESIYISDICDILQEHATKYFDVYVKYCSNQIYQDRCLKNLKETNPQFVEVLKRLEASRACQGLSMYSFLMLPMQRITRLPLLVDAIFNRLQHGVKQYETCKQALTTLNKIVHECNEGASRMARMEEMMILSRQLDFREFKGVALISASRWLVKKGELTRLIFTESAKLPFGRRCTKQNVYLFLFTDLLIITKKKSDDCYNVVDYCPRNMVQVSEIDMLEQLPDRPPDGCKNLFQLCMLQNHDNKTVEMFFCCPMESDRTRWMDAVTPKKSENPDERIYEEWDCPQVQAIHNYEAQQPDELSLEESDVVNVFRKMADGWYQGERIRDGVAGWFPSNYTVEIVSSHVRARNLRQRYRILALSQSYLEEQRKKENKGK